MPYTDKQKTDIINSICKEIEEGRALRTVLKDEGMPDSKTLYDWIDKDERMLQQYARATELRAEKMAEEILEIADDQEDDVYIDDEGKEFVNHNVINRARLRVDSRKWLMSKMFPKKYGDKVQQDVNMKASIEKSYSDEELEGKINDIITANTKRKG